MTATGGGPPGDDPNKALKDFARGCRNHKPLVWSPTRIRALPGGRRSVAILLMWHANSQVLCGHVLRFSQTPLAILGAAATGSAIAWYKYAQQNQSREMERLYGELEAESARAVQQAQARVRQLEEENQQLRAENDSWLNIKSWFRN